MLLTDALSCVVSCRTPHAAVLPTDGAVALAAPARAMATTETAVAYAAVDAATHAFAPPHALLRGNEHLLDTWLRSDAASMLLDAISTLGAAVQGVKRTDAYPRNAVRADAAPGARSARLES